MDLATAKSKVEQLCHRSCFCDSGGPFPNWPDKDRLVADGDSPTTCNATLFNAFEALAQNIKDLEIRLSALEQ
jgi:hypothetical protein